MNNCLIALLSSVGHCEGYVGIAKTRTDSETTIKLKMVITLLYVKIAIDTKTSLVLTFLIYN